MSVLHPVPIETSEPGGADNLRMMPLMLDKFLAKFGENLLSITSNRRLKSP